MKKIFSTYFESVKLGAIILITFKHFLKENRIELEEVKFFEKETEVINQIKKLKIELIIKNDIAKIGNIQVFQELILDYLSGKDINIYDNLKDLNIDIDMKDKFPTEFSQSVINKIVSLHRGEVTTYSEIGNMIDS